MEEEQRDIMMVNTIVNTGYMAAMMLCLLATMLLSVHQYFAMELKLAPLASLGIYGFVSYFGLRWSKQIMSRMALKRKEQEGERA